MRKAHRSEPSERGRHKVTRKRTAVRSWRLIILAVSVTVFAATALGVELTVLTWMSASEVEVYRELLKQFEAEHDVQVTVIRGGSGTHFERLTTMIAGGSPPDIFYMNSENLMPYVAGGFVEALDSWIARDGLAESIEQDFFPTSISQYRIGGELYALPSGFGNRVIGYDINAFAEAGIPEPTKDWSSADWTFDDLREAARRLYKTDSDGTVTRWGFSTRSSARGVSPTLYSFGARYLVETDDGYETGLVAPEAINALSFLQQMIAEGWGRHGDQQTLAQGLAAITQFIPANVRYMQEQAPDVAYDIAPWPRGPGGRWTSGGGTGWSMSSQSKDPALAWELLKFLTSYEVQLAHMQNGSMAVPRRSVALHPDFIDRHPPQSIQVFIDAWFHIVEEPSIIVWNEYWEVVQAAYNQMMRLEISPQEFATRMATQGNAVLRSIGG